MFTTLIILAIIVSILLILAVLIQNPKGGGIAANFSAANQIAGVKKTNEFIEKATWTLAFSLMLLAVGSRFVYSPDVEQTNDFLDRISNSQQKKLSWCKSKPIYYARKKCSRRAGSKKKSHSQ